MRAPEGYWRMITRVGLWLVIFWLLLALQAVPAADVQETGSAFDPYPLRPVDTTSPRDTLRSFNSSITKAIQAWRAGEPWEVVQEHESRAMEAVDFSQLPKGSPDH